MIENRSLLSLISKTGNLSGDNQQQLLFLSFRGKAIQEGEHRSQLGTLTKGAVSRNASRGIRPQAGKKSRHQHQVIVKVISPMHAHSEETRVCGYCKSAGDSGLKTSPSRNRSKRLPMG